ncbi:MFS transporter [Sphingomonas canadensis]|uniref:MFS transporter n=1 Tax=Sphingomonas canadensis TaxID=1219257 RepID=A0ABW3HDV4_9SPHN|nr:MFS transporter [Sphingomonas canadensis]MCW3838315.1 MFS transporter [Sphingomonas canadensis]
MEQQIASDRPGTVNLNAALDDSIWTGRQKLILALIALAYLTDGIANQSMGLAIPALMHDWGMPREAFASIAAFGLLGLTLGAVVGGMLGDRFGRRTTMIASTAFFGAMTMAQAWVTNPQELLALRFLDGIGIGAMIPNGAALISELTPRRERALALAVGMTFIAVGAMVAGLIGNLLLDPYGWQGLFLALGGIALLVAALLFVALPESPIYLVNSGASQERLRAVAARCGLKLGEGTIGANTPDKASTHRTPLGALFTPDVASSTIFLWIAFFFCLLANYAMFSWVPAMLAALGFKLSLTSLGMTALSLGGIVGGVGCGWLIKRFGSRATVLSLGSGGVIAALGLGLMIMGEVKSLGVILASLAVIGVFSAGLLNGLYTFSALIYPDHARGTGVGAAAAAGRVGAIASSWAGVIALGIGGASSYFLLIAGALAVSVAGVALIRRQIPKAV